MRTPCVLLSLGLLIAVGTLAAAEDPFADLERPKPAPDKSGDPFADLEGAKPAEKKPDETPLKNRPIESKGFFEDNFTIKKEVYGAVTWSDHAAKPRDFYSRQSVGFEILKKFSTKSATVASFNIQGRLVRRDNFLDTPYDGEGRERDGFFFEYHNLYWDFYNVLNPVLGDAKGDHVGRFNFRLGRFYLPFGLNLQTDTHGSLLQLSNDRNFGFERDWYAGLWGSLNQDLNYDFYAGWQAHAAEVDQHVAIATRVVEREQEAIAEADVVAADGEPARGIACHGYHCSSGWPVLSSMRRRCRPAK